MFRGTGGEVEDQLGNRPRITVRGVNKKLANLGANPGPPGSWATTTEWPRRERVFSRRRSWLVLPLPSIPSKLRKAPRFVKLQL